MRTAPYKDYKGSEIKEGDTVVHPSGERGVVEYHPYHDQDADRWRVNYGTGVVSRLCLQLGYKGRGVVAP